MNPLVAALLVIGVPVILGVGGMWLAWWVGHRMHRYTPRYIDRPNSICVCGRPKIYCQRGDGDNTR